MAIPPEEGGDVGRGLPGPWYPPPTPSPFKHDSYTPTYNVGSGGFTPATKAQALSEVVLDRESAYARQNAAIDALLDAKYREYDGKWGKWVPGRGAPIVDPATGKVIGYEEGELKFVPIAPTDPLYEEFLAADREVAKSKNYEVNIEDWLKQAASGGASGGGGSGGGAARSEADILKELLFFDDARSDEIDARRDDWLGRVKAHTDLTDKDQAYAMRAQSANLALDKALYDDDGAAANWGQYGHFYGGRPTGGRDFITELLETIGELPRDYQEGELLGLPGDYGMYGKGTIPRYAAGTRPVPRNPYGVGSSVGAGSRPRYAAAPVQQSPADVLAQLLGLVPGLDRTTADRARFGDVFTNARLPPSQQNFGGQAWDELALRTMLDNIASGRGAAMPQGYSGPDFSRYAGKGQEAIPDAARAALATWVRNNPDNPDLVYLMGTSRPADDPNAFITGDNAFGDTKAQSTDMQNWLRTLDSIGVLDLAKAGGGKSGGSSSGTTRSYSTSGGSRSSGGRADVWNSLAASGGGGGPGSEGWYLEQQAKLAVEQWEFEKKYREWQMAFEEGRFENDKERFAATHALNEIQMQLQKLQFEEAQLQNAWTREMQAKGFDADAAARQWEQDFRSKIEAREAEYQAFTKDMQERGFYADEAERIWQRKFADESRQWEQGFREQQEQREAEYQAFMKDLQERGFTAEQAEREWQRKFSEEGREADLLQRQLDNEFREKQFAAEAARFEKAAQNDRAKAIAAYGASGGADQLQRDFFVHGMQDPVGNATDMFTGENRGRKTLGQAMEEDAPIYQAAAVAPKMARGGPVNDFLAVLGDDPKHGDKASGFDELLINWTLAPIDVVSNEEAVEAGIIPPKGRRYSDLAKKSGRKKVGV